MAGLDLIDELLEIGRRKAAAASLETEGSRATRRTCPSRTRASTACFRPSGTCSPRAIGASADEMVRVCRKGGQIVTSTWTPEGVVGKIFGTSAAYMLRRPTSPRRRSCGAARITGTRVGAAAASFEFERHLNRIEWASVEGFADFFMDRFGPLVTALAMLGERFGELREQIVSIWEEAIQADDGSLRLSQEYLVSIVRL